MALAVSVIAFAAQAYVLLLMARLVLELVLVFARAWRPRGWVAVIVEMVYTVTDPPLRLARRFIPPVRLGGMALDVAFAAVLLAATALSSALFRLAIRLGGLG
ncbi:MAG: YggT family protein [Bifidobacteriaceae bacterium]|jgi:YggT family protein|nr:YggT family protein [Bifidobacteriaceae bacterium]